MEANHPLPHSTIKGLGENLLLAQTAVNDYVAEKSPHKLDAYQRHLANRMQLNENAPREAVTLNKLSADMLASMSLYMTLEDLLYESQLERLQFFLKGMPEGERDGSEIHSQFHNTRQELKQRQFLSGKQFDAIYDLHQCIRVQLDKLEKADMQPASPRERDAFIRGCEEHIVAQANYIKQTIGMMQHHWSLPLPADPMESALRDVLGEVDMRLVDAMGMAQAYGMALPDCWEAKRPSAQAPAGEKPLSHVEARGLRLSEPAMKQALREHPGVTSLADYRKKQEAKEPQPDAPRR